MRRHDDHDVVMTTVVIIRIDAQSVYSFLLMLKVAYVEATEWYVMFV